MFRKVISLKIYVITRLEFELAYYNLADRLFNHYTTGTLFTVLMSCVRMLDPTYVNDSISSALRSKQSKRITRKDQNNSNSTNKLLLS